MTQPYEHLQLMTTQTKLAVRDKQTKQKKKNLSNSKIEEKKKIHK